MIKKLLSSLLLITWLLLGSFSYWVSYTCSYEWIVNSVARQWTSTTYSLQNCNYNWNYYDCNVFVDLSISQWNCYQIWWFDLSLYDYIDLNLDMGWNYISFSKSYNNLDQLDWYTVCNPSRFMFQGRVNSYYPDLSFTITTFPEYLLTNYSYTYTCPTCQECQECQECPSCPSVNTWEILSGYILESEITTWYCETRFNMIEPSDCPSSWTWDIIWSSFWVNNRQVLWWKNIFLYLPDFLNWDYTYIDEDLEINVENEWDYEYMQWVIDNQTTTPNKTDLNNIITGIIPLFIPWLIIILFIYFVFRFIKKIF